MRGSCKKYNESGAYASVDERLNSCLHRCGSYLFHHSVDPRQTLVVQLLKERGAMTQTEIQDTLEIQAGSVSELISKLERKGIVERQRLKEDRRRAVITLTPDGQSVPVADKATKLRERYRALDEAQKEMLSGLLERLLEDWTENKKAETEAIP